MSKNYLELISLPTFEERFEYLRKNQHPYDQTFGNERHLNQIFYQSPEWKRMRNQVIIRDMGCDLGIEDRPINTKIIIHHINPITAEDVVGRSEVLFDMNNLICCSYSTHQAIHYGDMRQCIPSKPNERTEGDTKLWTAKTFVIEDWRLKE